MMELKSWNAENLWQWVQSPEYLRQENIPISPIRAFSQINNPHLQATDILLITFHENNKLVAYLGFLPDSWCGNRFAWMSCLWVKPDQRGKKLASQLLEIGLELWEQRLIATEFSPEAGALYIKSKKFPIEHIQKGLRIFYRHRWAKRIPERKPKLSFLKPILSSIDFFANSYQNIIFSKNIDNQPSKINFESLQLHFVNNPVQRNIEDFKWITQFPWLKNKKNATESDRLAAKKYYFSTLVDDFSFEQLTNDEDMALLSFRDGHWKIPYLSGKNWGQKIVKKLAFKGDMLTIYQKELLQNLRFPAIYRKNIQRTYLLSSGFSDDYDKSIYFQDGDGDCVFT